MPKKNYTPMSTDLLLYLLGPGQKQRHDTDSHNSCYVTDGNNVGYFFFSLKRSLRERKSRARQRRTKASRGVITGAKQNKPRRVHEGESKQWVNKARLGSARLGDFQKKVACFTRTLR